MKLPFVGPAYTARSKNFDAQRAVNLYPEIGGGGASKNVAALIGTPGLRRVLTFGGGAFVAEGYVEDGYVIGDSVSIGGVRGLLRISATQAIAVVGPNVYFIDGSAAEAAAVGAPYVADGYVLGGYVA